MLLYEVMQYLNSFSCIFSRPRLCQFSKNDTERL